MALTLDTGMITGELFRAGLPPLLDAQHWHCLMERYSEWDGEWSDYYGNYRWQPLGGSHRALGDSLAALSCLNRMADSSDALTYPDWLIEQGLSVGVELTSD